MHFVSCTLTIQEDSRSRQRPRFKARNTLAISKDELDDSETTVKRNEQLESNAQLDITQIFSVLVPIRGRKGGRYSKAGEERRHH
jgi:hypothetical protein